MHQSASELRLRRYYERTLQYGKAARKYWRVANAAQPLALTVRISAMEKAIAVERRSTSSSRRGSDYEVAPSLSGATNYQAATVPQVEAVAWPKFLQVAQLQLDAVNLLSGNQFTTAAAPSMIQTPARGDGSVLGRDDAALLADDRLLSLQEIIQPLRQALERSRRIEAGSHGTAGAHIAKMLLCCYDAAVAPPEDRQALQPFLCQLWAAVIEAGKLCLPQDFKRLVTVLPTLSGTSLDEVMDGVVTLHRDYNLGPLVFTLGASLPRHRGDFI